MSKVLARLWNDDEGAIISVEMILVIGIVIFGIIPGLVALRNSTVAALTNIGNVVNALSTTVVAYDGIGVGSAGLAPPAMGIAYVGGISFLGTTDPGLSTSNTTPVADLIAAAPSNPGNKMLTFP